MRPCWVYDRARYDHEGIKRASDGAVRLRVPVSVDRAAGACRGAVRLCASKSVKARALSELDGLQRVDGRGKRRNAVGAFRESGRRKVPAGSMVIHLCRMSLDNVGDPRRPIDHCTGSESARVGAWVVESQASPKRPQRD